MYLDRSLLYLDGMQVVGYPIRRISTQSMFAVAAYADGIFWMDRSLRTHNPRPSKRIATSNDSQEKLPVAAPERSTILRTVTSSRREEERAPAPAMRTNTWVFLNSILSTYLTGLW